MEPGYGWAPRLLQFAATRLSPVFDHVTIRASDRNASERLYRSVLPALGLDQTYSGEHYAEWDVEVVSHNR